jgi:uncharacterized protein (TIRG00374 family)
MKNKISRLFISSAILLFIIYNVKIDFAATFASIEKPIYLIYCISIPLFIIPLIVNNRWKLFLKIQGINERFFSLVKINFVSVFLGILLPSSTGFDAIRIYFIEKRNRDKIGAGGASVVIERLVGFYLLSVLGVVGAAVAQLHGVSINVLFAVLLINCFILFVFFVLNNQYVFSKINAFLLRIKKAKKITNYLTALYSAVNNFPIKKVLLLTVPLIILFQLSSVFCGYLLFRAFGINLPFFYHLAFLPLLLIISILPISISGFGIREGGFVYFYGLLGVSDNISFLVSLLYYFILTMIPAFVGMLIYIFGPDDYKFVKKDLQKDVKYENR